jgi:hypothetical protein
MVALIAEVKDESSYGAPNHRSDHYGVSMPWLNVAGLIFGMLGAAILFWRAPPPPSFEPSGTRRLMPETPLRNGLTVAQHDAAIAARRRHYTWIARLGFCLIFLKSRTDEIVLD